MSTIKGSDARCGAWEGCGWNSSLRREQKKMEKEGGRRIVLGGKRSREGGRRGGEAGEPGGLMTSFLPGPRVRWLAMAQWAQRLEKRDPLLPSAVWYGPSANGKGGRGAPTFCQLPAGDGRARWWWASQTKLASGEGRFNRRPGSRLAHPWTGKLGPLGECQGSRRRIGPGSTDTHGPAHLLHC